MFLSAPTQVLNLNEETSIDSKLNLSEPTKT